jgi:hypothetical protein
MFCSVPDVIILKHLRIILGSKSNFDDCVHCLWVQWSISFVKIEAFVSTTSTAAGSSLRVSFSWEISTFETSSS